MRQLPFVALLVSSLSACSSVVDGPAATDEAALASATRVFVVPVDERARALCREETLSYACDEAGAEAAAQRCLARIGAKPGDRCAPGGRGCLAYETQNVACEAPAAVYPDLGACTAPVPKTCAFYAACLEATQPCGTSGYALGYGEKYCYAFKNARFSRRGEAWRDNVMGCLQRALVPVVSGAEVVSCETVTEKAFASHPACYTERGHSICFLPPTDLAAIFATIGAREIFAARTLAQVKSVVGTCIVDIGRLLVPGQGARLRPSAFSTEDALAAEQSGEIPPQEELEASLAFWSQKAAELERAAPEPVVPGIIAP